MIKIDKDNTDTPDILNSAMTKQWTEKALHEKKEHRARDHIYGHNTVQNILKKVYNNKCGYCESRLEVSSSLEIDHYRPKNGVSENSEHPGYYWLTYEWTNLISSCNICNRKKGTQFPIEDESKRVMEPQEMAQWKPDSPSFLSEKPLILNPEIDQPDNHLEVNVHGEICKKNESIYAETTIKVCNLNRDELIKKRKAIIDDLRERLYEETVLITHDMDSGQLTKDIFHDKIRKRFEPKFLSLRAKMNPKEEYFLLRKCISKQFESFFINTLPDGPHKKILNQAFKLYHNMLI